MIAERISLQADALRSTLLPRLRDRVFHVTRLSAYEKIVKEGTIRANGDGALESVFGSSNSFFRKRNCVSFFDYRFASTDQIDDAIRKCSPYRIPAANPDAISESEIVYLFLAKTVHAQLIPWTLWKEEEAYADKVVPFVEAGFQSEVSTSLVEEVLFVNIVYPTDGIAERLHRAQRRLVR